MILKMSEEFAEWLDTCPVQWFLEENDNPGSATYQFIDPLFGKEADNE